MSQCLPRQSVSLYVSYAETKCLLVEDVETLCLTVSLSDVSYLAVLVGPARAW